jgi:hypothetical protein
VGGSEGEHSKKEGEEKRKGKEEDMVVGKRKPNKESALGPVGFGPQAQRVEACGRC